MTLKTQLQSQKLLESFTPSGSEFYNDPKRCADFIREQFNYFRQKMIEHIKNKK
jgi:hypothetical protein